MKKLCTVLAAWLLLCSLAACGAGERTPEQRIAAVLEALYNVPDKYHREHAADMTGASPEKMLGATPAWLEHNRGRFYEEDFADGVLEKQTSEWAQNGFYQEMNLLSHEAQTTVKSTEISVSEKSELLYHFTASVTLRDRGGTETDYPVKGNVRLDETGKITDFRILDQRDLFLAVAELP